MPASIAPYTGPVVITLGYLALYYGLMVRVGVVKTALARTYREKGEKFDRYFTPDRQMLAADRAQLNMLEHMPPFLALLWLNAAFVSPGSAAVAGGVYLATRAAHPLLIGSRLGRGVKASILLATGPGYLVLLYFMGALLWAMLAA